MSQACHRRERAEGFRKSNYISHAFKNKMREREAEQFIRSLESYFQSLAAKAPGSVGLGKRLQFRYRGESLEYLVEMTGNQNHGTIVLTGGYSEYSEIHYSPRAIHLYRSKQEVGVYSNETALYLNRRLPEQSVSYGSRLEISRLLKNF